MHSSQTLERNEILRCGRGQREHGQEWAGQERQEVLGRRGQVAGSCWPGAQVIRKLGGKAGAAGVGWGSGLSVAVQKPNLTGTQGGRGGQVPPGTL